MDTLSMTMQAAAAAPFASVGHDLCTDEGLELKGELRGASGAGAPVIGTGAPCTGGGPVGTRMKVRKAESAHW